MSEIPTIDPEIEPEYVGAHSAIAGKSGQCQNWIGETTEEIAQCDNDATHTIVMIDNGGLRELSMCDDCGEPQDVTASDREWSGDNTRQDENGGGGA